MAAAAILPEPVADTLTERTVALLRGLPGRRSLPLSTDFAVQQVERNGVRTWMTSEVHAAPGVDWLRITRIENARGTAILNVAAYPDPAFRVPVLHLETVVLRGRLFVAVLEEALTLPEDQAVWPFGLVTPGALLDGLGKRYADALPDVDERPSWARGVLDEATLWSRPNTAEAIVPALACLVEIAAHWVETARLLGSQPRSAEMAVARARSRRAEICRACIDGGPSRPFLRTFFSEDWADAYIEGFLFPYASDGTDGA